MKYIPNILSIIRILLVGLFVWLFWQARFVDAIIVYAVAFFTDILDGYLARRFDWITPTGKLLDPAADKLMVLAALACIFIDKRHETFYLVLFVLAFVKELLMLIGVLMMLKSKVVAHSDWAGKMATGLFVLGIVLTLFSYVVPHIEPWNIAVLSIAIALSYYAMLHYAKNQMFAPRQKNGKSDLIQDEELAAQIEKYIDS
ncbi:MAG: CDP-alcohol phosphatidyltransferase family protein [Clostridiales bacterium]|nr:CDP-alcohol phosphatidyltransferase family protein [Clostridiales bacterium]